LQSLLIFSIVFHHYDNLYRALQGESKPGWLNWAGLFLGGRILLIGIFVLSGWDVALLAWYFGILFLGVSSIQWVISSGKNRVTK
jgi:hypothetical protein